MVAAWAVDVIVVVTFNVGRFHFQLQAHQVGGQWAHQQVGVLGVAFFYVHANQQLAAAIVLDQISLPCQTTATRVQEVSSWVPSVSSG